MLNFIKLIQSYWLLMLNRLDWHLSNAAYKQHLACASEEHDAHWEAMEDLYEHIGFAYNDIILYRLEISTYKHQLKLDLIKILNTHIKF